MKVHSYLFKDTSQIQECQVVQYRLGEIVFRIVKRADYTPLVEKHLIKNVKKWISPTIAVQFEYVAEIERTEAGKFKEVISYLDIKEIPVNLT
jgi:phenylacetate-CoA ligase